MAAILDESFGSEIYPMLTGYKYEEHSWTKRVDEEEYLIFCPYCGNFVVNIYHNYFDCTSCGKAGFNTFLIIMDRESFLKEIQKSEENKTDNS